MPLATPIQARRMHYLPEASRELAPYLPPPSSAAGTFPHCVGHTNRAGTFPHCVGHIRQVRSRVSWSKRAWRGMPQGIESMKTQLRRWIALGPHPAIAARCVGHG